MFHTCRTTTEACPMCQFYSIIAQACGVCSRKVSAPAPTHVDMDVMCPRHHVKSTLFTYTSHLRHSHIQATFRLRRHVREYSRPQHVMSQSSACPVKRNKALFDRRIITEVDVLTLSTVDTPPPQHVRPSGWWISTQTHDDLTSCSV